MIRRAMAGTLGSTFSLRKIKENTALGLHSLPRTRQWKNILFHSDGRGLRGTVLAAVHEGPLFSRMGPKDMTYAVAAGPAPSTFYSGSAACWSYLEAFAEKVPVCAPCPRLSTERARTLPFLVEAARDARAQLRGQKFVCFFDVPSRSCPARHSTIAAASRMWCCFYLLT